MIAFTKDTHLHTNWSADADADATFEAYVKRAKELGLSELTFTEHHDIDAVHPLFHDPIDFDAYVEAFERARTASPIPLRLGVEVGYQSHVVKELNDFLGRYPFEHVILSIHYLERKDLYTGEYYEGKTKDEAYRIYFETCLEAIRTIDNFDSFGHFDYITRYSPFGPYDYDVHKDIIDDILRLLIDKNKALELNTSGYKYEGRLYPDEPVIRRYLELGGTKFTLGSDAHRPSELAGAYDQVQALFQRIHG